MIINLVGHSRDRSASDAMKKAIVSSAFCASSFVISILIATRGSAKITMDTRQPDERETLQSRPPTSTDCKQKIWSHLLDTRVALVPHATATHYQLRKHGQQCEVYGQTNKIYIYIYIDLPLTIDSNKQLASNRRLRPSCPFQSARTRLSLSYSSSYHNINVFDRSPNLRINTHRGYYWHRGSPQSTLPPPAYQSIVCRHCCHLTLIKSPTPTCAVYELPSCLTAFHRSSFPRAPTPVYRTGNLRRSQRAAGKVKRTEWDHVHR